MSENKKHEGNVIEIDTKAQNDLRYNTKEQIEDRKLREDIRKDILKYIDAFFVQLQDHTGEKPNLSMKLVANHVDAKDNETTGQGVLLENENGDITYCRTKEHLSLIGGYELLEIDKRWANSEWWKNQKPKEVTLVDITLAVTSEYLINFLPDEDRFKVYKFQVKFDSLQDAVMFYLTGLRELLEQGEDPFAARLFALLDQMLGKL